jgi:hypothetical protein
LFFFYKNEKIFSKDDDNENEVKKNEAWENIKKSYFLRRNKSFSI